jgi:hypothetical protein
MPAEYADRKDGADDLDRRIAAKGSPLCSNACGSEPDLAKLASIKTTRVSRIGSLSGSK